MSDVLDLDALVPVSASIKFDGQVVEVKPPKTGDVLRLGFLGQQMEKAGELNDVELEKLIADLTAQVVKVVPELASKELNMAQLLKLAQLIGEMAMPPDAKELEKRGIKTDSPKAP